MQFYYIHAHCTSGVITTMFSTKKKMYSVNIPNRKRKIDIDVIIVQELYNKTLVYFFKKDAFAS